MRLSGCHSGCLPTLAATLVASPLWLPFWLPPPLWLPPHSGCLPPQATEAQLRRLVEHGRVAGIETRRLEHHGVSTTTPVPMRGLDADAHDDAHDGELPTSPSRPTRRSPLEVVLRSAFGSSGAVSGADVVSGERSCSPFTAVLAADAPADAAHEEAQVQQLSQQRAVAAEAAYVSGQGAAMALFGMLRGAGVGVHVAGSE